MSDQPPSTPTIEPPSSEPPPPSPDNGGGGSGGSGGRSGLPLVAKILLFAVLPLLVAVVLVITVLSTIVPRVTSNDQRFDLDAGSSLSVDVRNATLSFVSSDDSAIHVNVGGFSWGGRPPLRTDDSGDVTQISGGCRGGFPFVCRMSLAVALPANLPLEVNGTNGRISVEDLSGVLTLHTTNGAVEVSNSSGTVEIRTTNGAITVENSTSARVAAGTTNGAVDLAFVRAPRTVVATSTNGAIDIRLPDDGSEYRLDTQTINGRVETSSVPTDNDSARSISARTTNGGVSIEVAD